MHSRLPSSSVASVMIHSPTPLRVLYAAQQSLAVEEGLVVQGGIIASDVAPIASRVLGEKEGGGLAAGFDGFQGGGGADDLAELELAHDRGPFKRTRPLPCLPRATN